MTQTAEAVIVGGGVMGCSILYNLAALGVTDTILLEKDVLASGSTSRSQAILRMHYSNEVTTRMAWESLRLYKEFEELTGGPSGYVRTGYFLIVDESDRQALEENVALQRRVGVETDAVSMGRCARNRADAGRRRERVLRLRASVRLCRSVLGHHRLRQTALGSWGRRSGPTRRLPILR